VRSFLRAAACTRPVAEAQSGQETPISGRLPQPSHLSASPMKYIPCAVSSLGIALLLFAHSASAVDPASIPTETATNSICPISGKPVNAAITMVYEGRTYSFAQEACRAKFKEARDHSLYQKLGGKAAIDAAVEAFYVKVLADDRVKDFFENINMAKQRRKQKEFLSAAFGGPIPWTGKDMRAAHADLELKEEHFNAIAENLVATLKDLKVRQELIDQVVAVALTVKDDVLNREKKTTAAGAAR
jgi:hemoglobin